MYFIKRKFEQNKRMSIYFLMMFLIIILFVDKIPLFVFPKISNFLYIAKPFIWLGISIFVIMLPKTLVKAKLRYREKLLWWVIYLAVIQLIINFFGGMIDGFGKSPYNTTKYGIVSNVFIFGTSILGQELSRSYILNNLSIKYKLVKITFISVLIGALSLNLTMLFDGGFDRTTIIYFASEIIPKLAISIFASYLVMIGGSVYSIMYITIIQVTTMMLPILPDLKWVTKTFIGILGPLFSLIFLQYIYSRVTRERKDKDVIKENYVTWVLTGIVSVSIVWFTLGIFPVYPSVIVTGSMQPLIRPGDMVIVKKIEGSKTRLNDIIQFKNDNIFIFHRVIKIKDKNGLKMFRTKGDNNRNADSKLVETKDIMGKVMFIIPKIGWPTLLIKDRNNDKIKSVVEN